MAKRKLNSVDPVPTTAIPIEGFDLATASIKQARGIVYACQQATLYGRDLDSDRIAEALWAADDLLRATCEAITPTEAHHG